MKRVKGLFLATLFWVSLYFLLIFLTHRIPGSPRIDATLAGIVTTLWALGLVYPLPGFKKRFHSPSGRRKLLLILVASATVTGYLFHLLDRSWRLYRHLGDEHALFIGKLRTSDIDYGYRHTPNARSFDFTLPRDTIAVFTDADGFRIPVSDTARINKPGNVDILFIGCSFTYGEVCQADSIFSDLVARDRGLSYINAGVSGWGLSQMYVAAQTLIPKYKPRIVVFQYSYWLPKRGASPFKYSMGMPLPNPYFATGDSGRFHLKKPNYQSALFDIDKDVFLSAYRNRPLTYIFTSAIPLFFTEDVHRMTSWLRMISSASQPVSTDDPTMEGLSDQVFHEFNELSRRHGATPYILYLKEWSGGNVLRDRSVLARFDSSQVIDAVRYHEDYLKRNPSMSRKWSFVHRDIRGGDTIRIDGHPNNLSHRLIARSILDKLNTHLDSSRQKMTP